MHPPMQNPPPPVQLPPPTNPPPPVQNPPPTKPPLCEACQHDEETAQPQREQDPIPNPEPDHHEEAPPAANREAQPQRTTRSGRPLLRPSLLTYQTTSSNMKHETPHRSSAYPDLRRQSHQNHRSPRMSKTTEASKHHEGQDFNNFAPR